jgi:hypothetical protein
LRAESGTSDFVNVDKVDEVLPVLGIGAIFEQAENVERLIWALCVKFRKNWNWIKDLIFAQSSRTSSYFIQTEEKFETRTASGSINTWFNFYFSPLSFFFLSCLLLCCFKEENFNGVRRAHFLVEETLNAKCKEREIEQVAEI